jgi:SAM-dependent methyltransferase
VDTTAAAYEDFQYENLAFRNTHPDWLGTVGRIFGMDPARADRCRVLELGCGPGGNLVPLAELLPGSEFVGVDLSSTQIARARADAAAVGVNNVRFEAMDIRDVPDWGPFDYVICHGVFSWVPDEVRRRILAIASEQLSPQGIAYVSYNTLPGWHARGMLRAILRRVVPAGPPQEMARTARTFLRILATQTPERLPLGAWLRGELMLLDQLSDRYLYFEYLVDENVPLYFDEFLQLATDAGLQHLGDADVSSMLPSQLGEEGERFVDSITRTQLEQEQLLDYLTIRLFRRTLLCRRDVALEREIDHRVLADGWIGADLTLSAVGSDMLGAAVPDLDAPGADTTVVTDDTELTFADSDGLRISSDDPTSKAMLLELARAGSGGRATLDIVTAVAQRLGRDADAELVDDVCARSMRILLQGRLDAGRWRRPTVQVPPERPRTTAVVRMQALAGETTVVGPRHEHRSVDPLDRVLLAAMDGTRDLDVLIAAVISAQASGTLSIGHGGDGPLGADALQPLVADRVATLCASGLVLDVDEVARSA